MPIDVSTLQVGAAVKVQDNSSNSLISVGHQYTVVGIAFADGRRRGKTREDFTYKNDLIIVQVGKEQRFGTDGWWHFSADKCELPTDANNEDDYAQEILKQLGNLNEFHDGSEMSAPGILLAASSPVLRAMLSTSMQEGRSKHIKLGGVSLDAAQSWLGYMTSTVLEAEGDILAEVTKLADQYDMPRLLATSLTRMCDTVQAETAFAFVSTMRSLPHSEVAHDAYAKLSQKIKEQSDLFEAVMDSVVPPRGVKRKAE